MEPTPVGSFDNKLYDEWLEYTVFACRHAGIDITLPWLREEINEQIEKQIADSHDITKSNFGYE